MSKTSVLQGFKHIHLQVGEEVDVPALRRLVTANIGGLALSIDYLNSEEMEMLSRLLADILQTNTRLTALSLRDCGLGNDNISKLMKAVSMNAKSSLTSLDLSNNYLTDQAADAIIDLLNVNRQLKAVCLDDNTYIGEIKLSMIEEMLERNQQQRLIASNDVIERVA